MVRPIALASSFESDAVFSRMFIVRFATALKLSTLHQSGNNAVKKTIEELWHSIAHGKDLSIKLVDDRFYVNCEYVNMNYRTLPHSEELKSIFRRCAISEIHFEANMKQRTLNEFFDRYQTSMRTDAAESFKAQKVDGVLIIPEESQERHSIAALKSETIYEKIIDTYARLIIGVRFMAQQLREGENPQYAVLRQEMQRLWIYAEDDRDFLIGMTQKMAAEGGVENYAANVVVLTLLMAQELKISRQVALYLGVQALTQDLGRLVMPDFSEHQKVFETQKLLTSLKKIPLTTLKTILSRGVDAQSSHRLVCAFECQTGEAFKKTGQGGLVSWAGRFIAVPATFMKFTMPLQRQPLPYDRTAQILLAHTPDRFDPVFLSAFLRVMGIYPVGTFVLMSDDRMGIVMRSAVSLQDFDQPTIKLIKPSRIDAMGDVINLAQTSIRVVRSLPFRGAMATRDFMLA
jgi:hypothetical protein